MQKNKNERRDILNLRFMQYSISSGFFVKTSEVTKLTPVSISNETDFFWAIVPSVSSELPKDVLFLQETTFVPPHSVLKFEPKLVKIGAFGFTSSTRVENGISVDILIIEGLDIAKPEKMKTQKKAAKQEKPRETSVTDRIDAILMERENQEEIRKPQEKGNHQEKKSHQENLDSDNEYEKNIEVHQVEKADTKAQKNQGDNIKSDSSLLGENILEFARTEVDKM